jgi:hypothetical protein
MQRLRQLTEAECYARCYGQRAAREAVQVVRVEREERVEPGVGELLSLSFASVLAAPTPDAA